MLTGANRGIGNAMLHRFAEEGGNLWAFARRPSETFEQDCRETAERCGVWVEPVYCELTDTEALKAAFKQIMAEKKPLHGLVNNAGVMGEDKMFQMTSAEEMHRTFEVNFFAMVEVSRLATRLMARNKAGAVVNVASIGRDRRRQPVGLFRLQGRGDRRQQKDGPGAGQRGRPGERAGSRLYGHRAGGGVERKGGGAAAFQNSDAPQGPPGGNRQRGGVPAQLTCPAT